MASIEQRVKAIVAENMGFDVTEITSGAAFVDDLGADSLDAVELLMAFEEEFDIEISDTEADELATVKDAITLIEKKVELFR